MPAATGRLIEIHQEGTNRWGVVDCSPAVHPAPGQYLLANSAERSETIPNALFPRSRPGQALHLAAPLPAEWALGEELRLRGPLGRGFHLPPTAKRVALAAPSPATDPLLALASLALERGAAVSLFAVQPPLEYPPDVEILPLELLGEALAWADYLAACLPLGQLADFRRSLQLAPHQHAGGRVETLLMVPMPCGGQAGCGVCAVPTRASWQYACSQGPVFDLDQLEER